MSYRVYKMMKKVVKFQVSFLGRDILLITAVSMTVLMTWNHAASAQVHRYYPGRDSFLRIQTDSAEELARVLNTNPTARRNLATYFHKPEAEIVNYIKDNLILKTLEEDLVVTNHGVTKSGYIYPVKTRIKKGNRIWVDKNTGQPVLKWLCTNPVASRLPLTPLVKVKAITPSSPPRRAVQEEVAPTLKKTEPTPETVPMPVEPHVEVEKLAPAPPPEVPIVVPPLSPSVSLQRASVPLHIDKVAVPAVLLLSQFGAPSSSDALQQKGPIPTPPPSPNTVPEPGTVGLLFLGLGTGLALLRRRPTNPSL